MSLAVRNELDKLNLPSAQSPIRSASARQPLYLYHILLKAFWMTECETKRARITTTRATHRTHTSIEVDDTVICVLVGREENGGFGDFFHGAETLQRNTL